MKDKTKQQILNLASDLRRISWWACDKKNSRDILIERFLNLTKESRQTLGKENKKVAEIIGGKIFADWPKVKSSKKERLVWAERALTASLRLKHLADNV